MAPRFVRFVEIVKRARLMTIYIYIIILTKNKSHCFHRRPSVYRAAIIRNVKTILRADGEGVVVFPNWTSSTRRAHFMYNETSRNQMYVLWENCW